jgi:hypothetical protein
MKMGWRLLRLDVRLRKGEGRELSLTLSPETRTLSGNMVKYPHGTSAKLFLTGLSRRRFHTD